MRRLSSVVLVALAASAATATSALASPSTSTYGGNANGVQGTLHSAAKVSGGTLPFTGANLAAILGAALLLVVVGAVLRRRSSQS
jgi:hypothetical protein